MSAVVSRDFPASPAMSTTWPSPVFALAQRALPQFLFLPTNQSPRLCPSGLHARGPLARTEKPPGALTDDDRIRRGDALQTCCED